MAGSGVRVEGMAELLSKLERLGVNLDDLRTPFRPVAVRAARFASSFAPRRSGALAGSVRPGTSRNKAFITAGGLSVPYAAVQNYGWPARGIRPSSFMQRADKAVQPFAVSQVERAVESAVDRKGLG